MLHAYVNKCLQVVINRLIGPCGSLCNHVRRKCLSVLNNFGFPWPPGLDCSRFPAANNEHNMCMDGGLDDETGSDQLDPPVSPPGGASGNGADDEQSTATVGHHHQQRPRSTPTPENPRSTCSTCVVGTVYVNRTSACVPLCSSDVVFSEAQKRFVDVWTAVWSVLCIVSTAFALLTCLLRTDRLIYYQPLFHQGQVVRRSR